MNKPTDSVRIILFNQADPQLFLIVAESDDPDNWKLPGGKFNSESETPDGAATRELLEELNLEQAKVKLTNVGELTNEDGISARYIYIGVTSEDAVSLSSEISDVQWVSEETVPPSPNQSHISSAVKLARSAQK